MSTMQALWRRSVLRGLAYNTEKRMISKQELSSRIDNTPMIKIVFCTFLNFIFEKFLEVVR